MPFKQNIYGDLDLKAGYASTQNRLENSTHFNKFFDWKNNTVNKNKK